MFKQQKAKTYGKDKIKDITGVWRLSKKYDGHQIFIEKKGTTVQFFTSNHKQFNIEPIRKHLSTLQEDFILIGEYLYNCDGKLGDRANSSKVTTFRTNFAKGLLNTKELEEKSKIMIFDAIIIKDDMALFDMAFANRHLFISNVVTKVGIPQLLQANEMTNTYDLEAALDQVSYWVKQGWEGGMLIRPDSPYEYGKRVHHTVKLKGRHTADLLCIGISPGIGKYEGMIGSLRLKDSNGLEVSVGSGLCDVARGGPKDNFIGKVIEIQYERIDDTYIQPVYIGVRADKIKEEID